MTAYAHALNVLYQQTLLRVRTIATFWDIGDRDSGLELIICARIIFKMEQLWEFQKTHGYFANATLGTDCFEPPLEILRQLAVMVVYLHKSRILKRGWSETEVYDALTDDICDAFDLLQERHEKFARVEPRVAAGDTLRTMEAWLITLGQWIGAGELELHACSY